MAFENEALVLDFLEWLDKGGRPYADMLDAWHTHCPRLTIWEDAFDRGYSERCIVDRVAFVRLTREGRDFLAARRGAPAQTGGAALAGLKKAPSADTEVTKATGRQMTRPVSSW